MGCSSELLRMDRLHREKTHARPMARRLCRWRPSAHDKRCALMEKELRPDERWARAIIPRRCLVEKRLHRNGDPRVVLVNMLVWKILVTRVNRKMCRVEYGGNGWCGALEPHCFAPTTRKSARASRINICSSRKILPRAETGHARPDCLLGRNFLRRKRCEQ